MQKAAQAYFQTQVVTTSQGDLLILLYEGAIKFLKQAKVKIEERDYAEKGILISKAMDVVAELDSSLNVQKGGDLAQNLHHLYFFCNTRLLKANMNLDTAIIDEVIKILTGLQDAFRQIINEGAQSPQAAATQSAMPRPAVAQQAPPGNGANGSLLPGGLLPQPGAAQRQPAPGVQLGNGRLAGRPLAGNGAARAVQSSQSGLLEKQQAAQPGSTPPEQSAAPAAPAAASANGAQSKPRAQARPQAAEQPQAAEAAQPVKKQPAQKQQPVPSEQEQSQTLPKQPLNFNKARMLAGYKKMASQT